MPKVSVIIPTYNDGKYIKDAIDSVLAQTYKDYEIIVVNDGSTDNTEEVLKPYIEKGLIRYFYQENKGRSSARNKGIREARGKYIAFLDADDFFLEDSLLWRIKAIEKCDAEISFCDCIKWKSIRDAYDDGNPLLRSKGYWLTKHSDISCINKVDFIRETVKGFLGLTTITLLCKRELFGGNDLFFDETMNIGEDIDLWWRLLLSDEVKKIAFVNKPLSVYRFYDASWMKHEQWEEINFELDKKVISALERQPYVPKKDLSTIPWKLFWIYKDRKRREYFIKKAITLNPFSFRYWKSYIVFEAKGMLDAKNKRNNSSV